MNQKLTLAVSTVLMSMSMHSAAELADGVNTDKITTEVVERVEAISINKSNVAKNLGPRFIKEEGLESKPYVYIVHLEDDAVATYDGDIQGLEATNPQSDLLKRNKTRFNGVKHSFKLDVNATEVKAYTRHLQTKQNAFIQKASGVSSSIEKIASFKYALNGLAVEATPEEAAELASLPGVKYVERDQIYYLDTDVGPTHIGAPGVWDGTAVENNTGFKGEGIVIGILDSGVNADHPSFADIAGDGYDHVNPLGEGVYLGECIDSPERCNDKLIGIYSYSTVYSVYTDQDVFPPGLLRGEDYDGHGSHVASTAGGNLLLNVKDRVPEPDVEVSDGIETSLEFAEISGVAPRANIISYQVCRPGNDGDTYAGCFGSAIVGGIEDAIEDGVDVLNMSISGGLNPWQNATEMAFLSARNAGIFVAVSAGNSGPGFATTVKHAPWYTSVAASEHGRVVEYSKEIGSFTGGDTELADITGANISGGITASIVYAGDFINANDPDGDPAQCLEPFPESTFNGEIVVCDRGAIARVAKAQNAAAGGAGGVVLANLQGGATSVASDVFVIPGIHIDAENGDALKAWLATGTGHMATISEPISNVSTGADRVDAIADFSSRGPNTSISTLAPTVAAPGVDIMAAYADEDYGNDVTGSAPSDFIRISGTSMASPHTAGAGALVAGVQPTWTPDNIRSALAMTATTAMKKEDIATDADWFDMGSGRINVDLAVQAGLVMDEVDSAYIDANPADGGEPRTLNLPSITDNDCKATCSWSRTVTATKSGIWTLSTASISPGLGITISPTTFELAAGETQVITVTMDVTDAKRNEWAFGAVNFTSPTSPDLHWPVSVIAATGNLPDSLSIEASRSIDSYLVRDRTALEITDLQITTGLSKGILKASTVGQDSASSSVFDDITDGTSIFELTVPEGAQRLIAEILDSASPDLDLHVIFDVDADGVPTPNELVAISSTPSSMERVDLLQPEAGFYWLVVQNVSASEESASDAFTLSHATVVHSADSGLSIIADSAIPQFQPFDMRVNWNLPEAVTGDMFYGVATLGMNAENPSNLATIAIDINREADDVLVKTSQVERVEPGDVIDYAISVLANFTPEDRAYEITTTLPEYINLVPSSLASNASYDETTKTITWTLLRPSLLGVSPSYRFTDNTFDANCRNPSFGTNPDGGYFDLASLIGFNTAVDGDDDLARFGISFNFLGEEHSGFTVSSNGFISVTGDLEAADSWANLPLPGAGLGGIIAPYWRDTILDISNDVGAAVGRSDNWAIVDYQNTKPWNSTATDTADFQVVFSRHLLTDRPSIIYSYRNMVHGDDQLAGLTIGYESVDGLTGGMTHFRRYEPGLGEDEGGVPSNVVDGLQICLYFEPVPDGPIELPFSVEVAEENLGGPVQIMAMSSITNNEFSSVTATEVESSVQVEGAPQATIGGEAVASMSVVELTDLILPGEVVEPNGDRYTVFWRQISGPDVVLSQLGLDKAILSAPGVTEDTPVVLEMEVTEANGNVGMAVAEITILNNIAPTLSITAPQSVPEQDTITISAMATDPEGDALSYTIDGVPGRIYNITAPYTDGDTTVSFTVTVSDGLNTTTETVTVTVTDKSGGSMGWLTLLLLPVIYLRRKAK